MPTVYKVLGQQNPAATTATTLYTVPASTSTIASTLNVCNLANSAATFRVAVRPAGAALANTHYVTYDTNLPANDSIAMTMGLTLATTDVVTVYANTANVNFSLFGTELS
jgi:glucose-6-phosphate dehydrogenase assembly protein OpcA